MRILLSNHVPTHPLNDRQAASILDPKGYRTGPKEKKMAVKRSGGLLNVLVASGWLLLVASFGILVTPHNYGPAHGGPGKIAAMWIIISSITMARALERTSGNVR
jgi:hypothetical protein